jgi:cytochrome c biogenesis protein CcmG/thiol:disulfide interchange protein DsbE
MAYLNWTNSTKNSVTEWSSSDFQMKQKKIRSMKKPNIEYFSTIGTKKRMKNEVEVTGIPHVMIIAPKGIVRWEGWPALNGQELTEDVIQDILDRNGSKTGGKK